MLTLEDEIYRKAVDQVASLLSSYEAGRITAESFQVGIEVIWGVLGGVIRTDEFEALMKEANAEVRALPCTPHIELLQRGASAIAFMRTKERVRVVKITDATSKDCEFTVEDDAIAHVHALERRVTDAGYERVVV
jgi:hypothetical protein